MAFAAGARVTGLPPLRYRPARERAARLELQAGLDRHLREHADHRFANLALHAKAGALFALIFGGTITLGALSDGRRWGAIGWLLVALGMPLAFMGYFGVLDAWGWCFFGLLLVHGIDGMRRLRPVPA